MLFLSVFKELSRLARSETGLPLALPLGQTHGFHQHTPIWDYCNPAFARPFAAGIDAPEIFRTLAAGATLAEARQHTRLFVFLGARATPELDAAASEPGAVCLLFEPDLERLNAFLGARKDWCLAKPNLFFVGGDPDRLDNPLLHILPEEICRLGCPAFFALDGLAEQVPAYVHRVEQLLEIYFYRTVIYALDSQEHVRGFPLRPMRKDATYDRHVHFYENLEPCLSSGTLADLRGCFPGRTAILAGAGPALQGQLEFIRANQDRAVVIAVNNALRALLAAGIEPHVTVINDTSLEAGRGFDSLPPLASGVLVAHCLSATGRTLFPRRYFFGNFPGQPFDARESLLLHGSVITTAFSLAEYMGCTRAVLAGVQLSSPDPFAMNYSADTIHTHHASGRSADGLPQRWPQLYPVQAADGSTVYTTVNFFDAAQWFADRIRTAALEVVNLCPASILKGPGIRFDQAPPMPEPSGIAEILASLPTTRPMEAKARVLDFIRQSLGQWKQKQLAARAAAANLDAMRALVSQSDQDNTAFMVQRFEDFDNAAFHALFFDGTTDAQREEGGRYFCDHMARMCTSLLQELTRQHGRIADLRTPA